MKKPYVKESCPKEPCVKKLLLVGAGHAHIGLLRRLRTEKLEGLEVALITEQPQSIYSGMLPGWMANHYRLDEISIDIASLCMQAGVRYIQRPIIKVDAASRIVTTNNDEHFDYDILSLNTGADTDLRWLNKDADINHTSNTTIAIRPLAAFVNHWQQILANASQVAFYRLAIIGAGAAATELVMAAQVALQRINPNHQVFLVCGDELLPGFNQKFRRRVIKQLNRHNIQIIPARATAYHDGQLCTVQGSAQESLPVDAIIAATGVTGAAWTQHTDLEIVDNGFIAVNATQQSTSHPNVFAVGDVATRVDKEVAHSGVHAVYGGVVAADNLLAYAAERPLQTYQPRARTLYLLSCGDKYAIASWGKYSLQGRWLWYLKRQIDKRFVESNKS